MNIKELVNYCLSKTGAYEDFPFGPDVMALKLSSKMFCLLSEKGGKTNMSLKCDPFVAETLRQQFSAITAGYHLNKQHWNTVIVDGTVPENELKWMIDHSYELILKSLTKAEQEEIK